MDRLTVCLSSDDDSLDIAPIVKQPTDKRAVRMTYVIRMISPPVSLLLSTTVALAPPPCLPSIIRVLLPMSLYDPSSNQRKHFGIIVPAVPNLSWSKVSLVNEFSISHRTGGLHLSVPEYSPNGVISQV